MTKTKADKGAAFKRKLTEAGYRPAEFARLCKVLPQNLNNWFARGVPAENAISVADFLGCEPDEISDIKTAVNPLGDSEEIEARAIKRRLRDKISSVDDLKYLKMIEAVIDSAGHNTNR